ncbi:CHAT domain-containing tetratricopeptide repeat protein (plasmid) [Nostoc sp. UHCC 0302]|uniref:CHAT domain-containing protein n=1 Tax=Nostoc sp. UHCC 0302 TaxID=3134896 RepID=UPI00311CC56D
MRDRKLSLTVLITLILTVSQPIANLPPLFEASQVLAQTPADRKAEADRLLQQGNEQLQISQVQAALQSWQQALIIYREIKDRKGEGNTLVAQGVAYLFLGDNASAIASLEQGLVIARETNNQDLEKIAEESLQYAKNRSPRRVEADRLLAQGMEQHKISQFEAALQSFQQALIIYREIKDRVGEAATLGNLGLTYSYVGDYAKAIEYQQQALAITREIKDRQNEGLTLGNLGIAYSFLGDYSKAIEYYQQSLAIAREIKDRQNEGQILDNLGNAYSSLGDYSKVIEYYQQSLAIAREIKDRKGEGLTLGNLGIAYRKLGDYTKAIEYYQQSLAIAREFKDRNSEGAALGNLGLAYSYLGDYAKAIEYQQQSLAIAREIKNRLGEGQSLSNLGLVYQESGKLTEAETTLRTAIEVLESLREQLGKNDSYKVSIFEEQARTYRTLQQVLIAQNKTKEALEISERGRSRAFVELLTSRLSDKNIDQIPEKPTLSLLQQSAKQQNATLVEYSIIYDSFKIQGKQETQESELYIWVIKPTGEVTFRKADLKPLWQKENTTLDKLVTTSRNFIGATSTPFRGGIIPRENPDKSKAKQKFQQLHKLLIEPIADLLPKQETEKVIFIPQSSLFLVPFPALQDADGKYLIEKHTILTSPSIQVLDFTHKQKQRIGTKPIEGKDTLIVGNPTMPFLAPKIGETPQQLTPLPGAEQEAIAISKLLKAEPLIGKKATIATVVQRLPQARFVHLATHGLFDDIQGLNSGIALTPSGKDDGLLTASEILDLKLNAELVVLSACDTGRGRLTGDGVIGLSRSLISAGVPSVLVSLWSVPDTPTALLMTEFYQNLQKNPDKAQALRQAMLTTMKKSPNPVNWAAFTLIGEAE